MKDKVIRTEKKIVEWKIKIATTTAIIINEGKEGEINLKTINKSPKLATQILSPYSSVLKSCTVPNMVIEETHKFNNSVSAADSKMNIGKIVKTSLLRAQSESRVIIGLSASVKSLSKAPQDALFCFLAPPNDGDSATHMHEVLLQAYCFENDIYIIKVSIILFYFVKSFSV